VTSGTIFHRTRVALPKWFLTAYLIGRDKRGVSAKFLERGFMVAYQTAWSILHKLRQGLSEDPAQPLCGYLEADESYIGGRGDPKSPGRSTNNPNKSLLVLAVEKKPAPKNENGQHRLALQRQHGFYAGSARIAVLPVASANDLCGFLKNNVAAKSHLLTDGFAGYQGKKAAFGDHLIHFPVIQGKGDNAGEFFPIIHTLFSTIKAWIVGTHHGVFSAKHLLRYLREWAYCFNRRSLAKGIDRYLILLAVECAAITYDQLAAGDRTAGATRDRIRFTEMSNTFPAGRLIAEHLQRRCEECVVAIIARAGFSEGYFHCEFILTRESAVLIDANLGRIGGPGIVEQIAIAHGVLPGDILNHVTLLPFGEDLPAPKYKLAGGRTGIWYGLKEGGVVQGWEILETFASVHTQCELPDCWIDPVGVSGFGLGGDDHRTVGHGQPRRENSEDLDDDSSQHAFFEDAPTAHLVST